jgi:hypothetical protein
MTACPCGAELKRAAELAHHVCDRCRVDAKKRPTRKRNVIPDFVDVGPRFHNPYTPS